MKRPVLVDGNNVMGSRPDGWWRNRAGAAERLVAEIAPLALRRGGAWTIVFDGPKRRAVDRPSTRRRPRDSHETVPGSPAAVRARG